MAGKVVQRAEVRQFENKEYLLLKRQQFEKLKQPKRTVQTISSQTNLYSPICDHKANKNVTTRKTLSGKRERHSDDIVLDVIFNTISKKE